MNRSVRSPFSRRRLLRLGGLGLVSWFLSACGLRPAPSGTTTPPEPLTPTAASTRVAPSQLLRDENRPGFYIRFIQPTPPPDVDSWQVALQGLVEQPMTLSLDDIEERLPLVSQVSRMKCVECWSAKAEWGGFTYASLAELVKPLPEATHLYFECLDTYWEILSIEELALPRALFVHRMNGERLAPAHGGPLRLMMPWLYGYKSPKIITSIDFRAEGGRGYYSTVAFYSPGGEIQPGFDNPLDVEGGPRRITGGEITEY